MSDKLPCSPQNAHKFAEWIAKRGGIFVWRSINLSNPGASWSTPATVLDEGTTTADFGEPVEPRSYPKPNWQCANEPERHVTSTDDVEVQVPQEVKRFHVGVKRGDGLSFVVTNAGSRRIRRELEKAEEKHGKAAWYEFDYMQQDCLIFIAKETVTLTAWLQQHPAQDASPVAVEA